MFIFSEFSIHDNISLLLIEYSSMEKPIFVIDGTIFTIFILYNTCIISRIGLNVSVHFKNHFMPFLYLRGGITCIFLNTVLSSSIFSIFLNLMSFED